MLSTAEKKRQGFAQGPKTKASQQKSLQVQMQLNPLAPGFNQPIQQTNSNTKQKAAEIDPDYVNPDDQFSDSTETSTEPRGIGLDKPAVGKRPRKKMVPKKLLHPLKKPKK